MSERIRLVVPWIGAQFRLAEPWTFTLFYERRNSEMWRTLTPDQAQPDWRSSSTMEVTLPVNTLLSVDRIYIRRGAVAYDSLTFWLKETTHPNFVIPPTGRQKKPRFRGCRFWAKLPDVNRIICTTIVPKDADAATVAAYSALAGLGSRVLVLD